MNTMLTALTRPRISSGVLSWIMVERTMTLIVSAAPTRKSMISESVNDRDRPKATVKAPNAATHHSMARPALRLSGQRAMERLVRTAPIPGAAAKYSQTACAHMQDFAGIDREQRYCAA